MKASRGSKSIKITGITNESLMDTVQTIAFVSKCKVKFRDNFTKATVTGTPEQLDKFVTKWNQE